MIAERKWQGVVVSIYYDNDNPEASHADALNGIENGDSGPFYGPETE